jgi:thymidylate synthase
MNRYDNFTEAYIDLAKQLRDNHEWLCKPRGQLIKESLGVQFVITNIRDRLPLVEARNFSLSYLIAETIWYMSGNPTTAWISRYAPFWKNITDDGVNANSAYGARIFHPHPRIANGNIIQWNYVKEELTKDPDSRRAVIHIRTPSDSIVESKDVPCTLSLQFFIRGGKLHLHVSMRSSDIILGLAYDVPAFTIIQEVMANELGVDVGEYVHTSNSLHCYERDFEMLNDIANTVLIQNAPMVPLPKEFPTKALVAMEENVSTADLEHSKAGLIFVSSDIVKNLGDDAIEFVEEWYKVLLARRLKKAGDSQSAQKVLTNLRNSYYSFFNR